MSRAELTEVMHNSCTDTYGTFHQHIIICCPYPISCFHCHWNALWPYRHICWENPCQVVDS